MSRLCEMKRETEREQIYFFNTRPDAYTESVSMNL